MNYIAKMIFCALVSLCASCATPLIQVNPPAIGASLRSDLNDLNDLQTNDQSLNWWRYAVYLDWPEQQEASWYMDSYLADQLFAPVISQFPSSVNLWRFHRRAVRDQTGHEFTLWFYANAENAQTIYQEVNERFNFLNSLGQQGIKRVELSDINDPKYAGISAISDPGWYIEIQNSWPYFINGVSRSWLSMIQQLSRSKLAQLELPTFDNLVEIYKDLETNMNAMWRNQGAHAYIHHLSAMFGYKEVIVTQRRLMHF